MAPQEYYDCIIVGAGIAGINAAFRFQQAFSKLSYAILEGRDDIGGTWSLFQYPGIRSDSDLYTLSFPWDPWSEEESIAKGESIMDYLRDMTKKYDLDSKIKLGHKVTSANWDSGTQHWSLKVQVKGREISITTQYLMMGTGYYDAEHPYQAQIEGLSRFEGDVLHPQFWPKDFNYQGRKVVIIGSGATAITMLPAMHQEADHVTMLQRSPGYIISLPQTDWMRRVLRKTLPKSWAISLIRLHYILSAYLIFLFCKVFPILSRRYIQYLAQKQLPKEFSIDPHFQPKYHPWDQRLCIAPDGDFYRCLSTGKASIVTGKISTVTKDAIVLTSGESLPADIIVTATGLRLKLLGHVDVTVDNGPPVTVGDYFTWRGCMLQNIPNLFALNGYFLASYTLGIDNSCILIMRILAEAERQGNRVITPTANGMASITPRAAVPLTSGYVQRGLKDRATPKLGNSRPWSSEWFWFTDWFRCRFFQYTEGLSFEG
ncbi:putative monooxygenase [Fusarium sp. LHS14.1]|nr:putative monooxygenase [Fusarium sp. LHS14.1]